MDQQELALQLYRKLLAEGRERVSADLRQLSRDLDRAAADVERLGTDMGVSDRAAAHLNDTTRRLAALEAQAEMFKVFSDGESS